jgi:hypothetical protein
MEAWGYSSERLRKKDGTALGGTEGLSVMYNYNYNYNFAALHTIDIPLHAFPFRLAN